MIRLVTIAILIVSAVDVHSRVMDSVRVRVPDTLQAVTALDREDTLSLIVPSNVIVIDTVTVSRSVPRKNRLSLDTIGVRAMRSIEAFGNAGPVYNSVSMNGLPSIPSCCPEYTSTWGIEYGIGARYTWTRDDVLHWGLSAALSGQSTEFTKSEPTVILDRGVPVAASFQHRLSTVLTMLRIDGGFNYYVNDTYFLGAYIGADVSVGSTFSQSETLNAPDGAARFLENGSTTRNNYSGSIQSLNILRPHVEIQVGARFNVADSTSTVIRPTISYVLRPFSPVSGLSWATHSIAIGASVSFAIEEQYKAVLVLDSSASVLGHLPQQLDVLVPRVLNAPLNGIQIVNTTDVVHLPIHGTIMFSSGTTDLPSTYKADRNWAQQGYPTSRSVELAVIGERLKAHPEWSIELLPIQTQEPARTKTTDHHKRASSIQEYLTSVWGVDNKQIIIGDERVKTDQVVLEGVGVNIRTMFPELLHTASLSTTYRFIDPDTLRVRTRLVAGNVVAGVAVRRPEIGNATETYASFVQREDTLEVYVPVDTTHLRMQQAQTLSCDIVLRFVGGASKTIRCDVKVDTTIAHTVSHSLLVALNADGSEMIAEHSERDIKELMESIPQGTKVSAALEVADSTSPEHRRVIAEQIEHLIGVGSDDIMITSVNDAEYRKRRHSPYPTNNSVHLTLKSKQ